jgi:hypothetical protein
MLINILPLSAQITRLQADEIVHKYIIDEEIRSENLHLYINDNLSETEGVSTIVTSNNETFTIEYSCWVYYMNEWTDVNGPYFRRYLFINKANGNILEVKTRKDFGPSDIENWRLIYSSDTGLSYINNDSEVYISPNPVDDFLKIVCEKELKQIQIFDLQGKQVFQDDISQSGNIHEINVSFLRKGYYIVKIFDITKNTATYKILKK